MKQERKSQRWHTEQKRCREPVCRLNRCVLHFVSVAEFGMTQGKDKRVSRRLASGTQQITVSFRRYGLRAILDGLSRTVQAEVGIADYGATNTRLWIARPCVNSSELC